MLAPKDIERKELMCTRKFVQGFNINIISSLEELLSHVNSIYLSYCTGVPLAGFPRMCARAGMAGERQRHTCHGGALPPSGPAHPLSLRLGTPSSSSTG